MGGHIVVLGVVPHHTVGAEFSGQDAQAGLHHLHPLPRHPLAVALIELRNDLVLQHAVHGERVDPVLLVIVVALGAVADGPAHFRGVALIPPAVQNGAVEAEVGSNLHAARAAGLHGPTRVVQPDVDAVHQLAGHGHVVVLHKQQAVLDAVFAGEADDLLNEPLAALVAGMGLAAEDKLNGPLLVRQHLHDAVAVAEEQRGALVGGKAAGKADGERLGVQQILGLHGAGIGPVSELLGLDVAAHKAHHLGAGGFAGLPKLLHRDFGSLGPQLGGGHILAPSSAHVLVQQARHARAQPGGGMDAVCHRNNRHFIDREGGPAAGKHFAAHPGVQLGHAVYVVGVLHGQHGHVEQLVLVVRVDAAVAQELLEWQAEVTHHAAEMALQQRAAELVESGGDGGVGREAVASHNALAGGAEVAAVLLDEVAQPLKGEEGGMAFVHVADGGGHAKLDQGAIAADAEDRLLSDSHLLVAAIERVGDVLVGGLVFQDVAVQQDQRHPADLGPPDLAGDAAVGEVDGDMHRLIVFAAHQGERHVVEVVVGIALLLPAVRREHLAEISSGIEQSDSTERNAEVAGCLQVVSGQDAEAAGVVGEGFVDAEFRAEIGDAGVFLVGIGAVVPGLPGHVGLQVVHARLHPGQEDFVLCQGAQAVGAEAVEHQDGVVAGGFPGFGVEVAEKLLRGQVPRPAHVRDQPPQRRQGLRQLMDHFK